MKKVLWLTVLAVCLILLPSSMALAATSPELDSMEIIGSDGVTYLDEDDFDADDTSYSIDDLDDSVTYLKLYLDYDEDYDVEILYDDDDDDVTEKSNYWRIDVDPDDLAEITVIVSDDDDEETYTVELSADGSSSGSDDLEGLYLNIGDSYDKASKYKVALLPAFDADQTSYTALIPYDEDLEDGDLNLRLSLSDDDIDLEIDGDEKDLDDDVYDYAFDMPDPGESTTVEFIVEGSEYTLTVYFAEEDADDDAALDDLGVFTKKSSSSSYALDLSPDFDEDEDEYSLKLIGDYSKLYLYAPAEDDDMLVFANGILLDGDFWAFDPDDYDELEITVYAADLDESATYTIDLGGSGSAALTSLYIYSNGSGSASLSPAFTSANHNYVANVSSDVSSIYIYTSGADTVKVAQNSGSYIAKSSNTSYTLTSGLNTFDLLVGDTHYYLNVYRQAASASIVTSSQYISINSGASRSIAAYNINGNNFVKLRDLAYLLNGTAKQFSVSYNKTTNQITLVSGSAYVSVGGELTIPSTYKNAVVSPQSAYLNSGSVAPMAYNIDGNNYFLLRDLAALFDFQVSFSGNTVSLSTAYGYGGASTGSGSSQTAGDFSEISVKIVDSEDETCLAKKEFDPDDTSYDVEVSEGADYVYLYVYYDQDDYEVDSVKYDGDTVKAKSYSSADGYGYYKISIDVDDLSSIKVKITNTGDKSKTYTFDLSEDE